jgi:hypothetical protein
MISAYNMKSLNRDNKVKTSTLTAPQSIFPSPRSDESAPVSQKSSRRRNIQLEKKPQRNLPIGMIFKKSEGDDGISYRRQQPNTNDLAPVYDMEDARVYYSHR